MRILVVDRYGASLNWTRRLIADGHKVKWYVSPDPKVALVGKGIVDRVDDPRDWYKWADLIFFTDNTKWQREADAWRSMGWPVIAPGVEGAKWELLRDVGLKLADTLPGVKPQLLRQAMGLNDFPEWLR